METQGIVIWARTGSGALIVWCADNGALAYVADRQKAGDEHNALCVGDFVELRVDTVGAMRVGRDLRYRANGGGWVRAELGRNDAAHSGPVISPDARLAHGSGFGARVIGNALDRPPANHPPRRGSGAA